jgi:hypothetical protein
MSDANFKARSADPKRNREGNAAAPLQGANSQQLTVAALKRATIPA